MSEKKQFQKLVELFEETQGELQRGLKGLSVTSLKLYKSFYQTLLRLV